MSIDSVTAAIDDGFTVITATRRLSREIRKEYDALKIQQGIKSWPSARIIPINAWLHELWHSGDFNDPGVISLNESQTLSIWEKIISDDIRKTATDSEPLWNTMATARNAVAAWELLQRWNIELTDCQHSNHPDHRSFSRWSKQFISFCQAKHFIDRSLIPKRVQAHLQTLTAIDALSHVQLCLYGFDTLSPDIRNLLETLSQSGASIKTLDEENPSHTEITHCTFHSCEDEWSAASNWARGHLEKNPDVRLAIVTPDLRSHRHEIQQQLIQHLSPTVLMNPALQETLPFHLSLGEPLSSYSIIRSALLILDLFHQRRIPFESLSHWLLSPYFTHADQEFSQRGKMEKWCRENLGHELSLRHLLGSIQAHELAQPLAPQWQSTLKNLYEHLEGAPQKQPFQGWIDQFSTFLELSEWAYKINANSIEHQTVEAFYTQLRNLSTLDLVSPNVTSSVALSWLRRRLTEQIFAPETKDVPIQVLGIQEATGIEFDLVWFGGLTEQEWPSKTSGNPFIPTTLMHNAGVVNSSYELTYRECQRQQHELISRTNQVVFSCHSFDNEIPVEPSPLFPSVANEGQTHIQNELSPTPAQMLFTEKPTLERYQDISGLPLDHDQPIQGGSSIIENQSLCPFRAYSYYRLNAKHAPPPEPGMDAAERGSIVHLLLEQIWKEIGDSNTLNSLNDPALKQTIERIIDHLFSRLRLSRETGQRLLDQQKHWLLQLLIEWFSVEKSRKTPFRVSGIESSQTVEFGPLKLNLRIDRIDELENGSMAIIDYKTGESSPKQWVGLRPESTQIPLYASCVDPNDLDGIGFGIVRRGHCRYTGTSQDMEFTGKSPLPLPEKQASLKNAYVDWHDMLGNWKIVTERLAKEFTSGHAAVDPIDTACQYCELTSLCRINREEDDE